MVAKPKFLIVGAMKAGTTTLYDDLSRVPGIYLPPEKEPEDLLSPKVETTQGQAGYFAKFSAAPSGALCGEASTAYTKRPTHEHIAERARRVLGAEIKIIYLVRDPVRRLISQYHHQWGLGLETRPLNEAVQQDAIYRNYSLYGWQLSPWRAAFGTNAILVVPFEAYVAHRIPSLQRICTHLGIASPTEVDETHRNQTSGKSFVPRGGLLESLMRSHLYQFAVKPLVSQALRDRLKHLLLPKTPELTDTLSPELEKELRDLFSGDEIARHYCGHPHPGFLTFGDFDEKTAPQPIPEPSSP